MVRRFVKLIAILLAAGGVSLLVPIAVYADAPAPASHSVSNDQQSETLVTNTSSSHITTGTSDNNDNGMPGDSAQDAKIDVQTSKTVSSGIAGSDDSNDQTLTSDSIATTVTDTNKGGGATLGTDFQTPEQQSAGDTATANVRIAGAMRSIAASTFSGSGSASSAPATAPVSRPASNRQLPPVQGALEGLNGALATFVVPQTAKLLGLLQASHDFRTTSTAPIAVSLVIILTVLVGSLFVDYLRRSGYSGAARGDDPHGSLLSSFATPGKVDVIWATKPSYAPTFLVSEIKAVTQRF